MDGGSPILARTEDRVVIAGHTRLKAAQSLGLDKVLVRFLDLDPAEAKALALADNKLGEVATWDDETLADVLKDLHRDSVDITGLGFDDDALEALIAGPPDPVEGGDDVPDLHDGPTDSRQGEVYHLGPHRLMCGDCRDGPTVARLMDGAAINVAFTSPPYASQRKYDEDSGFRPIPPDDYVEWFDAVQKNVKAHLAGDGSWFVNIKEHCEDGQRHLYVKDLAVAHVRRWAWMFVDEFCWERIGTPGRYHGRFKNAWEPVFHFGAKAGSGLKFKPELVGHESDNIPIYDADSHLDLRGHASNGASILTRSEAARRSRRRGSRAGIALPSNRLPPFVTESTPHSAAFPIGLPSFFVRAFSDTGDIVFDPFLGSGTTLIAAAQHDRIAYGCEISPKYCDVIRRRWTAWARANGHEPGPGALEPVED